MIPQARLLANEPTGSWRIIVYPEGRGDSGALDVTFFRDAPTQVESLTTTDPFGPAVATVTFPSISMLDAPGRSDLWWLRPEGDIDICWFTPWSDTPLYRWEGYMASFDYSPADATSILTVTCRGALLQMDNYLAKPEYVYQPIPYEVAISRQFTDHPDLRVAPLTVEWPEWWSTVFRLSDYTSKPLYLRPIGVEDGAPWSGQVTRSTGSFDPALTSYIQGLLSNMYTSYGQFTILLDQGRRPVLRHRAHITAPDEDTLVVDVLSPGVQMSLTRDFTQRLNVVYGQGKAINGSTFSGMKVSADGTRIMHEPYAYRRQVHPIDQNDWYDRSVMRKEVNLSFFEGLNEVEARSVARGHLLRFSDPGVTATMTLTSDPRLGDASYLPRHLITAGMHIQVKGLFGNPEGTLFHVTECTVTPDSTELTLDSKFRDQLTVQEVRARSRDSLAPIRLLTVGQYKPNIPDMLFPWSYGDGSGFVPKGSQSLFDGIEAGVFPWTEVTQVRPPKDPQWASCYMHIPPASPNADNNWANRQQSLSDFAPYTVRMSQAGEASLVQIAAYDRNGNVLKVPFHVSFYKTSGTTYSSMPMLGIDDEADNPPYRAGQHYPFFKRAWEQYAEDGTALNPDIVGAVPTAQILVGYGNFYEKAGYWPNTSAMPAVEPTGLLSDEGGFSWDLTDAVYGVDPQRSADENLTNPNRADIYVMIYCDAQLTQDVYFLGRIFRKEPGTA